MKPVNFGQIVSFGKNPILYEAKLDVYSPDGPKLSPISTVYQYDIRKLGFGFTTFIKVTLLDGQSFSTNSYSTCAINNCRFLAISKDVLINELTKRIKRELSFIERRRSEIEKKYCDYSCILNQIKSYETKMAL